MTNDQSPTSGAEGPEAVDPSLTGGPDHGVGAAVDPQDVAEQSGDSRSPEEAPRGHTLLYRIAVGNGLVAVLSFVLAVLFGSILIVATDPETQEAARYIFARPGDFFGAAWDAVWGAYTALVRGAIFDYDAWEVADALKPLTETLKYAAPLILAGLGVGVAFRAGLFNIGGRGQMLIAGATAGWVAIESGLTGTTAMIVAVLAAMVAGALWAGIAGLLKARTGAHEVIVTIMLNYVAFYVVIWALKNQSILQAPNSGEAKSAQVPPDARLPLLLGDRFTLHAGFLLALVAVAVIWWMLARSGYGYRVRAVGENPNAARTAGISVGRVYVTIMLIAGALMGLAAANQAIGTTPLGITGDLDGGIGFDAITVALLGRSHPVGILAAGLLFGAFKAGSFAMQGSEGIAPEVVVVVQALIVLFIAAPPLVRAIFRLPSKESK